MEIIKLKKLKNIRDISYGNIKEKRLIRSESLFRLPRKDQKSLVEKYNLKVVIDLRTTQEHNDKKDKIIPGIKYLHLPIITMEEMGASSEKEGKRNVIKNHKLPDIFDYYRRLVYRERKEAWTSIFNCLLDEEEGAILIHCTVGKDRAGIVAVMILLALGIDKETVYKDYLLTNEHPIIPFSYKVFALSLDKEFRKEFMEYFKAKTEYLDEAFKYIDEQYGGIDNFLTDMCGLTKEKRDRLKQLYCK